jgi:hypothetical protein
MAHMRPHGRLRAGPLNGGAVAGGRAGQMMAFLGVGCDAKRVQRDLAGDIDDPFRPRKRCEPTRMAVPIACSSPRAMRLLDRLKDRGVSLHMIDLAAT